MTIHRIPINTGVHSYSLYMGYGLLQEPDYLRRHIPAHQVMIISNETVAPLYLTQVTQGLEELHCESMLLPDGEAHKNLQTVNTIFDTLLAKKFHRNSTLIALGGGVIGDMTGFERPVISVVLILYKSPRRY